MFPRVEDSGRQWRKFPMDSWRRLTTVDGQALDWSRFAILRRAK
jgi:hypothetical protein